MRRRDDYPGKEEDKTTIILDILMYLEYEPTDLEELLEHLRETGVVIPRPPKSDIKTLKYQILNYLGKLDGISSDSKD